MSNVFALCRERVGAEEAARRYGITADRHGRALCPFHDDRHPSLSFRKGGFRCWSCGASGSAIDFTARLFGLSPLEAVRKLNGDFALDLPLDRPPTREERDRARAEEAQREAERRFREWREGQLGLLCAAIRAGNLARKRPMEDWSPEETLAVREQARLEWHCERLEAGSEEEQREEYAARKEVKERCTSVLRTATSGRNTAAGRNTSCIWNDSGRRRSAPGRSSGERSCCGSR